MSTSTVPPNRRILVVDDNQAIHGDFRKILGPSEDAEDSLLDAFESTFFGRPEKAVFEIDVASQGAEGVEKVRAALLEGRPYALAFVDVRMPPGWDGIETTRRLWGVDPAVQVVICTAYSDYSWEEMQQQTAPSDRLLILKKPFDTVEVQQLANALTEKWRLGEESKQVMAKLDDLVQQRTVQLRESEAKALAALENLRREMSEKQRLEQELRDQASLLDKARDAIFVRDMAHQITYWNKSAELLYGWTAEEAVGANACKLLGLDLSYSVSDAEVCKRGEWAGEVRQTPRHGGAIWVESRWTLVRGADGEPKAVMVFNSDITQKKQMEENFLRVQRVESIGVLASGIAHDLNNTLVPILMAVDLLKLSINDARLCGILDNMASSANRSANMVKQLLSFARGVEGPRQSVSAKEIVEELAAIVTETFPRSIAFQTRLSSEAGEFVADPTQVHQVLLNLCVNARDAMPSGGSLTVAADLVNVEQPQNCNAGSALPGRYIRFQITDTGAGIPEEIKDSIFDPFFTTKETGKGTGLGLSSVMSIISSHQGFLNLESSVGRGSSFSVHFPLQAQEPSLSERSPDYFAEGRGQTILLVDDEEEVRSITQQTLQAFGYQVITAANGAEAVEAYRLRSESIDVVLTDVMMPVMNGDTAIREMRRINPRLKVIAATGLHGDSRADSIGPTEVLPKPYSAATMLETVDRVLNFKAITA